MLILGLLIAITPALYASDCGQAARPAPTPAIITYFEAQLTTLTDAARTTDIRKNFETLKGYAQQYCYTFPPLQQEKVLALEHETATLNLAQEIEAYRYGKSERDGVVKADLLTRLQQLQASRSSESANLLLPLYQKIIQSYEKSPNTDLQASNSSSCQSFDLRPNYGPVGDQANFGNCYAYACASLLEFYLPGSPKISENDITIAVAQSRAQQASVPFSLSLGQAGNCHEAIEILQGLGGACLETTEDEGRAVTGSCDSSDALLRSLNNSSISDLISAYAGRPEEQRLVIENNRRCRSRVPLPPLANFTEVGPAQIINPRLDEVRNRYLRENQRRWEALSEQAESEFTYSFQLLNQLTRTMIAPGESYLPHLRRQLDKREPVGIALTSNTFSSGSVVPHAMLIVGRQWNSEKGHCEYIARNSWGTRQGSITLTQQAGYIFIPEQDLIRGLDSIEFMERK